MKNKILFFIPFILLLNNSCDKNEKDEPEERGTISIDFTTFQLTEESPTYTQDNVTIEVTETTSEDGVAGHYSFDHLENSEIWLYPARLEIDLHRILNIVNITIEGSYLGNFFFYDDSRNIIESETINSRSGDYSINFNFETNNVNAMAITSFEGTVRTIIIE